MKQGNQLSVAVLYGGYSAERDVSIESGKAVYEALTSRSYRTCLIDTKDNLIEKINCFAPDVVFNVVHGTGGEDGQLQALLEYLNLPYTGSGIAASALGMDKLLCKRIWSANGLPIIADKVLSDNDTWVNVSAELGDKFVIKPSCEGSSVGVSLVDNEVSFTKAYQLAVKCRGRVIAEKYMPGREFTVPVVGGRAYPAIQMVPENEFYDYNAKYLDGTTEYRLPSGLSGEQELLLQKQAVDAFDLIGAKDWGRVDFIESSEGDIRLLELNTVPGMTASSLLPKSLAHAGIGFEALVEKILLMALKR